MFPERSEAYRDLTVQPRTGEHRRFTCPATWSSVRFPMACSIPLTAEGSAACRKVVDGNAADGVTWVHSYVSPNRTKTSLHL